MPVKAVRQWHEGDKIIYVLGKFSWYQPGWPEEMVTSGDLQTPHWLQVTFARRDAGMAQHLLDLPQVCPPF